MPHSICQYQPCRIEFIAEDASKNTECNTFFQITHITNIINEELKKENYTKLAIYDTSQTNEQKTFVSGTVQEVLSWLTERKQSTEDLKKIIQNFIFVLSVYSDIKKALTYIELDDGYFWQLHMPRVAPDSDEKKSEETAKNEIKQIASRLLGPTEEVKPEEPA